MRKLKSTDIFKALRLVQASELKEELKPLIKKFAAGESEIEDIGFEGILTIISVFSEPKSEKSFYEFLSGPFEMTPEEVANLDIDELINKLEKLKEENNLKAFFTYLQGLITTK